MKIDWCTSLLAMHKLLKCNKLDNFISLNHNFGKEFELPVLYGYSHFYFTYRYGPQCQSLLKKASFRTACILRQPLEALIVKYQN